MFTDLWYVLSMLLYFCKFFVLLIFSDFWLNCIVVGEKDLHNNSLKFSDFCFTVSPHGHILSEVSCASENNVYSLKGCICWLVVYLSFCFIYMCVCVCMCVICILYTYNFFLVRKVGHELTSVPIFLCFVYGLLTQHGHQQVV